MSKLQSNPYQPPALNENSHRRSGIWNTTGRICVLIYGVLFALDCAVGAFNEIQNREPIFKTVFWIAVNVLATYGVLALAIRNLRVPQLSQFWQFFAVALPFLICLPFAWKIYHDPLSSPFELVIVLAMFSVIYSPALVFNWMVKNRLNEATDRLR